MKLKIRFLTMHTQSEPEKSSAWKHPVQFQVDSKTLTPKKGLKKRLTCEKSSDMLEFYLSLAHSISLTATRTLTKP